MAARLDSVWLVAIALYAMLCFTPVSLAAPVTLHVSPDGNDAWTGLEEEPRVPNGPFATLKRARDELRALKAKGLLTQGATVIVGPGTYYMAETFTLGEEDSGTEAGPIVYRAQSGSKPVLCAGKVVRGFSAWRGKIMRCDLRPQGLASAKFSQLFFRGRRQTLARYPNFDPDDPHGGTWAHVAAVEGSDNHREFMYGSDEKHQWQHPQDATVPIFGGYDWAFRILAVAKHTPEQRRITLRGTTWGPLRVGDRYYVQGPLEELDAPGEWYLDSRTGTLYFWPPDTIHADDVVVPVADNVVRIERAHHVTIRGLVIEVCNGTAVEVRDSQHCLIAASVVRNCGSWGISISGGSHSGAQGNDVYWCGHGGIAVSGGDSKSLAPGHNFADNNYIHHCADLWTTYRPGVRVAGVGNAVSHNLIHDMPHAGILLGGNENKVEFNVVRHVNLQSGDTGGIYFCSRDWTQRGNVIRHNIFHHCGGFAKANSWTPVKSGKVEFGYPHYTWGIYLDDPTTGTLVYGNILYNVPICALHNHGGRDNVWENNVIINSPALGAGQLSPTWSEWPAIYKKLRAARYPGSPYLKRYPEIGNIAATHPEEMSGIRFLRNIVYYTKDGTKWLRSKRASGWGGANCQQLYRLHMGRHDFERNEWDYNCIFAEPGLDLRISLTLRPEPGKVLTWDEWRKQGQDEHSILADPQFVDPETHDYRLRPGSPALALGFKPIPVDKIGPYEHALRASWPIDEAPGVASRGEFTTTRYYEPPQYRRVPAALFSKRQGIAAFLAKAHEQKPLKVAYFGGGIHSPGGWRKQVMDWLRKRYGKVDEINAGICDCVRGSGFSVYRFRHDVLAKRPDLVFVDFTSADHTAPPDAIMRAIEGVVRQAWSADPRPDVVFLYAFRQGFESDYAQGLAPYAVSAYERVAEHYRLPSINMGFRIAELSRGGDLLIRPPADKPAGKGKLVFSRDGVRPSDDADKIYAEVITTALAELAEHQQPRLSELPAPYVHDHYERARLVPITRSMLTGTWEELPADDPLRKRFARHFDTIWFTRSPGARLSFKFRGTAASLFDIMGPDTGRARVSLDGRVVGIKQQVDPWAYYQRLAALSIGDGLPDAVHTATVELLPDPPDRTVPIESAKRAKRYDAALFEGVALRIGSIRLIGELVEE